MQKAMREIQALLVEIRAMKQEIETFNHIPGISKDDVHKKRACELLNIRVALLLDRLQELAEGNAKV